MIVLHYRRSDFPCAGVIMLLVQQANTVVQEIALGRGRADAAED